MRVEKIELIGFKSFSDRTVFNLHPGITCIVGPNGCGKSNIVDSFKWVLGEQSAKSLRGESMQEVIFAGSQSKKPRGMAEAALFVSGLGGADNGKDTLTAVTRRLYRSGDSDYMLNGSVCRLKDIRDLFLDTGLEMKSYSILEQDRISAILSAKPEERRFLIEEVAGVVKYRVRRSEAQSKIESSRRNLERIKDVIGEVKRQINSLDRQVKKAERYRRLMEELRAVELKIAKEDYRALGEMLEETLRQYSGLKEQDALLRAELTRGENELESKKIALLEKEKALDNLLTAQKEIEREMSELERALAVLNAERDNLKGNVARLESEKQEIGERLKQSNGRKLEIASGRDALRSEIESLKDSLGERSESLAAGETEIAGIEALLEGRRRDAFGISDGLGLLRNEHNRYSAYLEALLKKGETTDREAGEVSSLLAEARARLGEGDASIEEKKSTLRSLTGEKEDLQGDINAAKSEIEALRKDIAREREDLASVHSRLGSLKETVSADSGELETDIRLLASVSDAVEVPEEYELAIESALREIITGFILPAYEDVRAAVEVLKQRGMGRTAFIHMGAGVRPSGAAALPAGAIAWAEDLVRAKDEYSAVIKKLLGGVAVAKDLDAAAAINGHTVATLTGEVVEPSGAVIAGKSRGILTIKRRIRELEEDVRLRKSRAESLEERLAGSLKALDEKQSLLEAAGERSAAMEKELSLLMLTSEKLREEMERMERKLSNLGLEKDGVSKEADSTKAKMAEKEAEIGRMEEERRLIDEEIAALLERLSGHRARHEEERAESMDLRLSLNSSRERLAALENEEDSLEKLVTEMTEKSASIDSEREEAEARIKGCEAEAEERQAALKGLALRAGELGSRISGEREIISSGSEDILAGDKGLKELRAGVEDLSGKIAALDVERAEHRLRMENLRENIKNNYAVELDSFEAEPPTAGEREGLPEIKGKIEVLGPVSLGSLEEHEELRLRHEFLDGQREDLERSIAELDEAIRRINSTTRKKLSEAFEALRAKFSEVFRKLFGGGRAELVLTEEADILETGIDVIAQPPGKRLQNINLLSGGEKTLAALGLLFASFLIKPAPLCILDEADAALDESNTEKFALMLRELSKDIQFIVVTHNKVTMESADHIYGITMEEPGISKVISMKFADVVAEPAP